MKVGIQLYFPLVHNPARGNAASTFPQKEKKGLTKKGYPKVSNKHTNAGGGREESLSQHPCGQSGCQKLQVCKGREEEYKFNAKDTPERQNGRRNMNKREQAPHLPGKEGRIQLHRGQAEGSKVQGSPLNTWGGGPHWHGSRESILPMLKVYSPPRSRYIRYTK